MKTRRAILLSVLGLSLAAVATLALLFSSKIMESYDRASGGLASKRQVLTLWAEGKHQETYDACRAALARRPLDGFFLVYGGFSAFYAGVARIDDKEKLAFLESSVALLRKARLGSSKALSAELSYVLGKAYYHLGYYRLDQCVSELEHSRALGFQAPDLDEYLGMAYLNLGKFDLAQIAFKRALARLRTDQLLIALAAVYDKSGMTQEAIASLQEAIGITKDILTEEKARLTMAGILLSEKRYDAASAQYSSVLEKDSESADAHYGLGLVHEALGDVVQARAEWRKAVKIEPMHQAARLKLSQK